MFMDIIDTIVGIFDLLSLKKRARKIGCGCAVLIVVAVTVLVLLFGGD